MENITIAIDGYSSTGKSTIAKQLAELLNYVYVDTGAMYRSVALFAVQNGCVTDEIINEEKLIALLDSIEIEFRYNPQVGFGEVYLNGENVESKIRTLEISKYVSPVATISEVRKMLVRQQQEMGKQKGIVMDGRDIGTVVFPNAELKIFMTASAKTRAERRYKELKERGDDITYEAVLENVTTRDKIDTTREDSPLIKANDAIEIDNSNLSIKEQLIKIVELAQSIINKKAT